MRGEVAPGTTWSLPSRDPADLPLETRLLLDPLRLPPAAAGARENLECFGAGVLVEVRSAGRVVIPGAWAERSVLDGALQQGRHERAGLAVQSAGTAPDAGYRAAPAARAGAAFAPVRGSDLRLPAALLGTGSEAVLAWGETRWRLQLDSAIAVPDSCRPGLHSAAQLRRLALVALGRREQVALTLWQDPSWDVPWHDVRLVPRAADWFSIAGVPSGLRYADAARAQGVPVERLLPSSPAPRKDLP